MSRVIFDKQPPPPQLNPGRADIACFVGLMRRLPGATVPAATAAWLTSLGYSGGQIAQITNVPIQLESYVGFTSIFDVGRGGTGFGTDYLAAAVRSFFAQGGRRCYVVRVGDPVTAQDTAQAKLNKLQALLPNSAFGPDDATSWTGVSSLIPLEDVSFLLTPDLPILCASQQDGAVGKLPTKPSGPEEFVECSQGDITPRQFRIFPTPAPRLKASDYAAKDAGGNWLTTGTWASSVATILNYLSGGMLTHQLHLREIQYLAAFPIPQDIDAATAAENPSSAEIAQDIHEVINAQMPEIPPPAGMVVTGNISSAFLQLGYPWLKTSGSSVLLESLEPPDGALAGLLARNALTRGTFTSATKITPAEIFDVSPMLPDWEMRSSPKALTWGVGAIASQPKALIERFSLFGFTPTGLRLLSDVTAYPGESYRSGAVRRLVAVICRAARRMGESAVFDMNGPALWGRVQRFMQDLLTRLWSLNALDGASVTDAFSVRCDRTTMTQNDLDNGRTIVEITFTPAATIETIRVKLAMETSGTSVQEIAANLAEVS
jgi:hypothetical protein